MKNLTWLISVTCLSISCGGGGTDVEVQPSALPSRIQCAHDGDVWLCNEQNSCVKDQASEVVAEEESGDEKAFLVQPVADAPVEGGGLGQELGKLTVGGSLTIIAECGSNVNFSNSETVSTTTTNTESSVSVK